MAYNIFTQIQGPQIDISLFGDAAARGTELGKNVPTGLTSAIRGTQEGIQIGQQIAQNAAQLQGMQQQNTLRQNEINQIPISNRMQEAQAINAEAIAKQNEIKAAITSVDTDTQLKIQQQELTNNLQQAIQANQNFTNKQKVFNALREVDPNKQADILRDGEVLRSVLGDPKAADQLYGVLSRNPVAKTKYGMQLEQLGGAISFTKLQELENERQKAIIQSQKSIIGDFPTIQKNVSADGQLADIMERHGITDLVSLASRVRTRPTQNSALGGPTTYEVLVDDKPDEVSGTPRLIDDGSNTKLKLLQNGYRAQGTHLFTSWSQSWRSAWTVSKDGKSASRDGGILTCTPASAWRVRGLSLPAMGTSGLAGRNPKSRATPWISSDRKKSRRARAASLSTAVVSSVTAIAKGKSERLIWGGYTRASAKPRPGAFSIALIAVNSYVAARS